MVESNFQSFSLISVKMVVILENLVSDTFLDILSLITRKPLNFTEFSFFHVEERWKLVWNHYGDVCNCTFLSVKNAFFGSPFYNF